MLWRYPITQEALTTSITYYSLLASAPHGLGWAYIAVGCVALLSAAGRMVKVFKTGKGEVVFDGGSVGESCPFLVRGMSYVWAYRSQSVCVEGRKGPAALE